MASQMKYKPYGNQKIVKVIKQKFDKKQYLMVSDESLYNAMQNLEPNTFKVWLYLCDNCDGYILSLSSKHISELCNISPNTCRRCIVELVDKGYLEEAEIYGITKNEYLFWEGGKEHMKKATMAINYKTENDTQ